MWGVKLRLILIFEKIKKMTPYRVALVASLRPPPIPPSLRSVGRATVLGKKVGKKRKSGVARGSVAKVEAQWWRESSAANFPLELVQNLDCIGIGPLRIGRLALFVPDHFELLLSNKGFDFSLRECFSAAA